jgi:hypothetical protein
MELRCSRRPLQLRVRDHPGAPGDDKVRLWDAFTTPAEMDGF